MLQCGPGLPKSPLWSRRMSISQFPPSCRKNHQPSAQNEWSPALLLLLLLFWVTGSQLSRSQTGATDVGTIIGVVTDSSGAVVSRATVVLTDTATGLKRTTSTNETG